MSGQLEGKNPILEALKANHPIDKILISKEVLKSVEENNPADFWHVYEKLSYFLSDNSKKEILIDFTSKDENLVYCYQLTPFFKNDLDKEAYLSIIKRMVKNCNVFEIPQPAINDLWVAEKLDFNYLLEKLGKDQYKAFFHLYESWPGIADEALRKI